MPRRAAILVVDDEPLIGRLVERALGKRYDVTALTAAKDALSRFAAGERFDLVLCDLMMPEVSGMALYDEIAARDAAQAERIVFLTGGAYTEAARAFLEGRPHLEKPFDLAALEALVRARTGDEIG